jgi:two-component system sensor histidine kinase AlgZ
MTGISMTNHSTQAPGSGAYIPVLPDFRNFGICARALIGAEIVNWVALLGQAPSFGAALGAFADWAPTYELVALVVLLVLAGASAWLQRQPYRVGVACVLGVAGAVAMGLNAMVTHWLALSGHSAAGKSGLVAMAVAALLLGYFDWRRRRLSPADGQARMAALQARIRPHFLFNSLNTVIAVVRKDPATAEKILLDLSDLFRAVLAEGRGLVPLGQELDLARAYGEIESLRLGDRLRLHWDVDAGILSLPAPMLVLQPLLENAIRYGVEPAAGGGDVWVSTQRVGRFVRLEVRNRVAVDGEAAPGHGLALANIRERLALHYDAEARLTTKTGDGEFVVRLEIPLPSLSTGLTG